MMSVVKTNSSQHKKYISIIRSFILDNARNQGRTAKSLLSVCIASSQNAQLHTTVDFVKTLSLFIYLILGIELRAGDGVQS